MHSSLKRSLSFGVILTFLTLVIGIAPVESASKNAHGRIFNVKATGGLNAATVKWSVEYYHYSILSYSFFIHVYPKDHPFKTEVQTVSCVRSPCQFYIPTPKKNLIARPIPLKYYFVVSARIPSGGFSSDPSASVVVKFQPTSTPTPTPTAKPSPTPTPTAKPSPTPTPSPTVPTVSDFDGNYSGVLNVALTPALLPPQTIPFTLAILNGMGSGGGGGWYAAGYVTDAQGSALIHISHPLYGTFDFPVSFSLVTSTQIKSVAASGSRTITYPGIGELTIDFVFTVATK